MLCKPIGNFVNCLEKKKFSLYLSFLLILLFSFVPGGGATENQIKFSHLTIDNGLSHNTVTSIIQDRKGFLWFGTLDGLNRYDGHSVKIFRHDFDDPNSLSDSGVRVVHEDKSGLLWIGTESGLNLFDPEKEQFIRYRHNPEDPTSLCGDFVRKIIEDKSGFLWMGCEGGLNRFDPRTRQFTQFKHNPDDPSSLSHNKIWTLHEDKSGFIWVGTDGGGLNRFDPESGICIRYRHDPHSPNSLSSDRVRTIYEDSSGNLWVGTSGGGLNRLDRKTGNFFHYKHQKKNTNSISHNRVYSLYEFPRGVLWIGTYGGGLTRFDIEKEQFTRFSHHPHDADSLSQNSVWSIYKDRSEVLWFGTYGGGVCKFNTQQKPFIHFRKRPDTPNSLSNNNAWAIREDRTGNLWIGTFGGGLNKLDRKTGTFTHYRHIPGDTKGVSSDLIRSLMISRSGEIWIGTDGSGLVLFNPETQTFTTYRHDPDDPFSLSHGRVFFVYEDRSGTIWACTFGGGLNKFDRETTQFTRYLHQPGNPESLSHNRVFFIHEDQTGVLWVGTDGGLNKFDRASESFIRYQHDPGNPDSISHNTVVSIHETLSGELWLGTYGSGVNKFDPENGKFIRYGRKHGLPNEMVPAILEDDQGNLWISTFKGLSKFDPKSRIFRNYSPSDGIQSSEFNRNCALKTRKGELLFGGNKGVTLFDPDKIQDNTLLSNVVLTDFRLFNRPVPVGRTYENRIILDKSITFTQELELSYKDYVFSLDYAGVHSVTPEKNRYAYMMVGLEKEWNYVGNKTSATYTNLPAGKFVFKVKAANNDGIWNEQPTTLTIVITPPFWKTWWFQMAVAAAIMILIFKFSEVRMAAMKKRSMELESYNKKLNKEIKERKKVQEKLIDMRNYLSNIIDSMPSVLVGVDVQKNVTQWNSEAHRVTGIAPANALGRPFEELFPRMESEISLVREKMRTGEVYKKNRQAWGVNNEIRYEDVTVYPLTSNGVKGAVIRIDDVTQKVRMEEVLVQSEKMLSIGGMAAGMAHEVNNPLGGIMQTAHVMINRLTDTDLPANVRAAEELGISLQSIRAYMEKRKIIEMVNTIHESSKRAVRIVQNMLDFARKSDSSSSPCDLLNLLDQSLNLAKTDYNLKKKYDFRQIKIVRDFEDDIPYVPCESSKIQQVFLNILRNGAEAMQEIADGPAPCFTLRMSCDKKAGMVRIEISDNGPGMDKETLERIFEPFFTTKSKGQGTGLGMSISYFIITDTHNGKMWVESEQGNGTTFFISLPLNSKS